MEILRILTPTVFNSSSKLRTLFMTVIVLYFYYVMMKIKIDLSEGTFYLQASCFPTNGMDHAPLSGKLIKLPKQSRALITDQICRNKRVNLKQVSSIAGLTCDDATPIILSHSAETKAYLGRGSELRFALYHTPSKRLFQMRRRK
ncbi:hypothetical protein RRG08_041498 [Elysia crispata]|uniref:Uncharacterized protein n=1 Tax=Elysia crispata TaxID=231223 RepID=A0AAE0Y337_9GAST|nr:hypothetical protein RRG08_041498 [Elysia crispata]